MSTAAILPQSNPSINEWFENFIETLRTHQLMLETQTATKEVEGLYKVIFGGEEILFSSVRSKSMMYFVKRIIIDYLKEVGNLPVHALAFNHSNSHVLVWAEVSEHDQDATERELILAEATINAKYHEHGFSISTTIIEENDGLEVPSQYTPYKVAELA